MTLCNRCTEHELTLEEHDREFCMFCDYDIKFEYCSQLGIDPRRIEIDPEKYGRTHEDLENHISSMAAKPKEVSPANTKNPKKAADAFMETVNKDTGLDIYPDGKGIRKIVVNGPIDDIRMTIELPAYLPMTDKQIEQVKKFMQFALNFEAQYLAFSPIAGTDLELFLMEKYDQMRRGRH